MFKVIILILTVGTVKAGLSAGCPDGWLTHGGMCYLFSHGREDWPGSYEMCKIMGGQLKLRVQPKIITSYYKQNPTIIGLD
ncbi:oxidized low-density lipoprotein receptor 1-like [Ruditapes philippinarum]|uniref:oxidized low-density lipoprotein receptor 1-like n=1 Tax=Ruditapes philippinarum TaxID=129788 RepID=UPI00295C325A|nr:oxidized low-density lipoprotein receptor 1-like [Ruditapes philippinarum]